MLAKYFEFTELPLRSTRPHVLNTQSVVMILEIAEVVHMPAGQMNTEQKYFSYLQIDLVNRRQNNKKRWRCCRQIVCANHVFRPWRECERKDAQFLR